MKRLNSIRRLGPAGVFAGLLSLCAPPALVAQQISFDGELPRVLVFIEEEGRGKVAAREMTSFLEPQKPKLSVQRLRICLAVRPKK